MDTKESLQLSIVSNRVHGMPPPCFCCERKTFSPASNTGFSNVSSPSPPPPPAPPLASAASFSSINER
jgi:hypothetical protein